MPLWWLLIPAVLVLLAVLGWLEGKLRDNPRGDYGSGFILLASRWYAVFCHRLRVRGRDRIPREREPGPLIVVANHTAGLDPVLLQVACPFFIRWVMAEDMRAPQLEWFWRWWGVFFVDRQQRRAGGFRAAIRHLRQGGVVGFFPEGGIERPPGQLLPFMPGLGSMIKATGARVLAVTIEGTPQYDPAWASLWHTSSSVVHFREILDFAGDERSGEEIVDDLQRRFEIWTGYPVNERFGALAPEPDLSVPYAGRPVGRAERAAG